MPAVLLVFVVVALPRPMFIHGDQLLVILFGLTVMAALSVPGATGRLRLPFLAAALVVVSTVTAEFALGLAGGIRTLGSMLVPLLAAGLIAQTMRIDRILRVVDRTLLLLTLVSVVLGVAVPSVGLMPDDQATAGALRGIYEHRNMLGSVLIVAVITLAARYYWGTDLSKRSLFFRIPVIVVAMYLCGSASAMIIALAAVGIFGLVRLELDPEGRKGDRSVVLVLAHLGLAVGLVLSLNAWAFVDDLGRTESVDGRLKIMNSAIVAIHEHPWVGYGPQHVLTPGSVAAQTIESYTGYFVHSIHNGYLALALDSGVIAAVIGALLLLTTLLKWTRAYLADFSQASYWFFSLLWMLALHNLVETKAFIELGWFLLCLAAFWVAPPIGPVTDGTLPRSEDASSKRIRSAERLALK
jgi:exopolysaccharide production protein ExoQ